jgi:hypothetical protein
MRFFEVLGAGGRGGGPDGRKGSGEPQMQAGTRQGFVPPACPREVLVDRMPVGIRRLNHC